MADDFGKLLDLLGRDPGERLSISSDVNGRFESHIVTVAQAVALGEWVEVSNVWFGVGVLPDGVTSGRGTAADVVGIREVYADLDVKPGGMPDYGAARAIIDDLAGLLGVAPVAIVHTGGGLQPHWAVERSEATDWPDDDHKHRGLVASLLRRWGRLVANVAERRGGSVDSVYDLARVLRVPGSSNRKYDPPRTVVGEITDGAPVTLQRIGETLLECGIGELAGDRELLAETVAAPDDWTYGVRTCRYVPGMIAGWLTDTPKARHPWLQSQAVRIAAAHRLGCITETDHAKAVETLARQFQVLVTTTDPKRQPAPGEVADCLSWGIAKASTFDETRALRELGDHSHDQDQDTADEENGQQGNTPTGGLELDAFLGAVPPDYDWLIPGLLERGDRVILTGPEGGGKSTILRQIGVQAASGVHPFDSKAMLRPLRVLLLDLENSSRQVHRALRPLRLVAGDRYAGGMIVRVRGEGIDLMSGDGAWLESLVADAQPDLLITGPTYKLSTGDPTEEGPAKVVAAWLDKLRITYGCAVLLEAHPPHGANGRGQRRPERPYGASLWLRWPEFGLYLSAEGDLRHWRGPRDERDWPAMLQRGGTWPWTPVTRDRDLLWARIKAFCIEAGDQLPYRDLIKLTGASNGAIARAIEEHKAEWAGFEDQQGVS